MRQKPAYETNMSSDQKRKTRYTKIIVAYPFALIAISVLANVLLFGVTPAVVALPTFSLVAALVASAILLLVNHTWLMTSTELTRLNYDMHATPEEWAASGHLQSDVSAEGARELERRHNAHRNATENTVHFAFLALLVGGVSPVTLAAQVWTIGFAVGRLGHSFCYLTGRDGARGAFMSVSLISLYGLASYLAISVFV